MTLSMIMYGAEDQDDEVDGPFFVCSTSSWSELGKWVRGLPDIGGSLPQVVDLVEDGEVTNTSSLKEQLKTAVETYPPDPGVRTTVDRLLEVIGEGEETETLAVVQE